MLAGSTGMWHRSSISSADTLLPAGSTPACRGSSSSALAERADSSLLLIWLPVVVANQTGSVGSPAPSGGLQHAQHPQQKFACHSVRKDRKLDTQGKWSCT